jgi:Family of unknown function (DUF5681)
MPSGWAEAQFRKGQSGNPGGRPGKRLLEKRLRRYAALAEHLSVRQIVSAVRMEHLDRLRRSLAKLAASPRFALDFLELDARLGKELGNASDSGHLVAIEINTRLPVADMMRNATQALDGLAVQNSTGFSTTPQALPVANDSAELREPVPDRVSVRDLSDTKPIPAVEASRPPRAARSPRKGPKTRRKAQASGRQPKASPRPAQEPWWKPDA